LRKKPNAWKHSGALLHRLCLRWHKASPYLESDAPNPLSVYGKTKLAGDEAILAAGCEALILRTSWVYGARGNNFVLTMLRLAGERSDLRIVDDQRGAPTSSECIAQATADILAQILPPAKGGLEGRSGIYNLTNAGETTWFGFAKALLADQCEFDGTAAPTLVPIKTSEFPRPARRPANSRLSCRRLEDTFGCACPIGKLRCPSFLRRCGEELRRDVS